MTERVINHRPIEKPRIEIHPLAEILQSAEGKGRGHKAEGGESLSPTQILLIKDTFNPKFIPEIQGGVLLLGGEQMIGAVLPPGARRGERESLGLNKTDVQKVFMIDKRPEQLGINFVNSGLEGELFGFDPKTGEMKSMMNPGNPDDPTKPADSFRAALDRYNKAAEEKGKQKIPYTVEMTNNCVELTFPHGESRDKHGIHEKYLEILKGLIEVSEQTDVAVLIAPMANIPHTRIEYTDITKDKYTYDMTFVKQGWEAAQHFDIASIQPHVEIINHEAARNTINYLQHVMPILFAPTLSGPFMEGQLEPDIQSRYETAPTADTDPLKQATLDAMEQGEHHSYRPFGRFFGSPSGGILENPIPVDEAEYIDKIDSLLRKGEVNSVGRVGGHHTDRYRVDIPDHGTIELCALDPAGGRIERVVAMREFTRAVAWKMQMHYVNGEFDQKTTEYPALFGQEPSQESFQTDHFNMMRVAKDGPDAVLEGMDGQEHTLRELWSQLLEFTQEPLIDDKKGINYHGLPSGIVDEIGRAFIDPKEAFAAYRDEHGITSSQGYYETGIGTASQWSMRHAKDQIETGVSELDAIKANTIDVGKSYHSHVRKTTTEDIRRMFHSGFQINPLPEKAAKHLWEYQKEQNIASKRKGEYTQLGHPVELPQDISLAMQEGARATLDIITNGIKEAGGITAWMEQSPVMLGPDIVLNNSDINKQLDERMANGFGLPMEYDILLARDENGKPAPRVVEIHTAISYETSLAEMIRSGGHDPEAAYARVGEQSPAEIYASFSERYADGQPIIVMDTDPFDATKADKIGMQKLMNGTLPISPMDIEGKDENGYWYNPYVEDPNKPNDVMIDAEGKPVKDAEKREYVKHVFSRMAQEDLNNLWKKIKNDPQKIALISEFLQDGNVNWIWHPTWQHLGDKEMMPEVRRQLIQQGNSVAEQFVRIYGPGEEVDEPGSYIKKPTSAQGGVGQETVGIEDGETRNVEDGFVYQHEIQLFPVLTYMPGDLAADMRRAGQEELKLRDEAAGNDLRAVTGIGEFRLLIPPGWDVDGKLVGRGMARTGLRHLSPTNPEHPKTNVASITGSIKEHAGEKNFDERRQRVPFGYAAVIFKG